ncbi:hypothetical protein M7M4_11870 [Corynebacterium pseudogenitalium]
MVLKASDTGPYIGAMAEEVSKSRSVFAAIVTSGLGAAAEFFAGAELFGEEELVGAADVEALEAAVVLVSGAASVLLSTAAGGAESSPSSLPAPRNRKATKATMASSAIIATAITHPATAKLFFPFECRAMWYFPPKQTAVVSGSF